MERMKELLRRLLDPVVMFAILVTAIVASLVATMSSPHSLTTADLTGISASETLEGLPGGPVRSAGGSSLPKSRFVLDAFPVKGPIKWECLPPTLRDQYTLGGRIPKQDYYFDEAAGDIPKSYSEKAINDMVEVARSRDPDRTLCIYGSSCNAAWYSVLNAHPIKGKDVLIIGTLDPWLEAIALSYEAGSVTTVDFNKPLLDHPQLRVLSVEEFDKEQDLYDVLLSFSSLEHDGLGRYHDPLDPEGDLKRMQKMKGLLRPHGLLYLGVPVGPDTILWNANRVYGPIRFPMLLRGWNRTDTHGTKLEDAWNGSPTDSSVHVLSMSETLRD